MSDNNTIENDSVLDFTSSAPLYRQLADIIKKKIESGEYAHDEKIPTEISLSQEYNISRITVRKALEDLADDGLLIKKQGKGTFVNIDKSIQTNYPFMPFNDAVQQSGKSPLTKLLSYSLEVPSSKISKFLEIKENDTVINIRRLRYADDIPIMLENDYYLNSFDFLASEPLNMSTSEMLHKRNIFPIHGRNTVSICFATEEEAALFGIAPETPLLYVYSEIKDQDQRPIQVSKQIIRSDKYKLVFNG